MLRSLATRFLVALAAIAAVSCCSVARAETLSPTPGGGGKLASAGQSILGELGLKDPGDRQGEISPAVLRELARNSEGVPYHAGLAQPSAESQAVRAAAGMGFGFEAVPFEAFLTTATAGDGKNVVRTFIIIDDQKEAAADEAAVGRVAVDALINKFTVNGVGTTTSGSATLSILQVPPKSSSLVFTNVILKDNPTITK
jgi:hypothetical protein